MATRPPKNWRQDDQYNYVRLLGNARVPYSVVELAPKSLRVKCEEVFTKYENHGQRGMHPARSLYPQSAWSRMPSKPEERKAKRRKVHPSRRAIGTTSRKETRPNSVRWGDNVMDAPPEMPLAEVSNIKDVYTQTAENDERTSRTSPRQTKGVSTPNAYYCRSAN